MTSHLFAKLTFSLVLVYLCGATFFQDGFTHHYMYKAKSDFLGMHNVTTIMKFHVHRHNRTSGGGHLNALWLDSFVQFTQAGQYAENPLNWNLSRPFLFTVSPSGIVLLVHVHPEEETEVSTIKKVLSSTFSANVVVQNESHWTYTSTDSDHIGTLHHEYNATRTLDGIQLKRYHRSIDHVERIHLKTMHLDNRGTVRKVDAEDNIILENRLQTGSKPKREPYPEEYVIKTKEEGDIGKIKANAVITMRLLSKRPTRYGPGFQQDFHGLLPDYILHPQVKENKESLSLLQDDILTAIECTHQYSDKSDTNRTVCVNTLRQKVTSLHEDDYTGLVTKYLSRFCEQNDTKCQDERLLFVDIVARVGDEVSQKLVIKYVFQVDPLDDEAIRRALIHFTTIEKPAWETVLAVEKLCFGENNEHHGSISMTIMVQRSCLALGALAKALKKNNNDTAASALLEKLHSWLYKQGDETPEHLRPRRSTINLDNKVSSDHLLSKFVLLHSLGNAAHPSSLPHLREYATPNSRIPAWRRAALAALNFDKGHQTAQVLIDSLTYEQVETVRATAMEQFTLHPLQKNFTHALGNVLLGQNYTYPTVLRLKRAGDLNAVLLEFLVELPEVHWGYSVGNDAIGAGFGIDMVNRMHLRIKPLSGFFHINIWDRVFAEAHVGIVGIRVDILRIEACYKGKLEYNLNILKDFSYGQDQKDFDEYDQAAGAIVTPIVTAVEGITSHFRSPSGPQSVFQPLTDSVKEIPTQARRFLDISLRIATVLDRYQGLPLVSRARQLAFKLQALAEDIKADALNFYNGLADTALIALPHAEIQITEASNMIVEAQKKLGTTPQQAFESINIAKLRIKRATYQIIKAKSDIQDALSPHGGSLPTWISSQDEIKIMATSAEALLKDIKNKISKFATVPKEDEGLLDHWHGLTDIKNVVEKVMAELTNLANGVKPFHSIVTKTLRKIQAIKQSVDELDKMTKETQNNVKKSFGPKFTKAFPAQRRGPDQQCGRGEWPSTTGEKYKDSPGIDVIVEYGWKVVCPVNGKVYRTCNDDELRIVPTDDQFKMFTILIRNLKLSDSIAAAGSDFKAGQVIGKGKGKSGCKEPYIHVAMRKQSEEGMSECSYVNPSSYVDNIKPFPKWQEECKEFVFKHIGNIIEAGLSGLGFEDIIEELAKRAMAWAGASVVKQIVSIFPKSTMAKMAGTMAYAYLSQHNSEIANAFMGPENQAALMEEKCEQRKTTTTTPSPSSFSTKPNSTDNISPGREKLTKMIDNLKGNSTSMQKSVAEIEAVIEKLKSSSSGIQLDDMSAMAFNKYGKILGKLNIPFKGSKQAMETTLQMLSWTVCPTFENGVAQGYGHVCIPSNDCLGLNCTIRIPNGMKKERISISILFDRNKQEFAILVKDHSINLQIDGSSRGFEIHNLLPAFSVIFLSNSKALNISTSQVFQLTLSATVCDSDARCLQEVHIFHDLTFLKEQQRLTRSVAEGCTVGAELGLDNVGHIGGQIEVDKDGHVSSGGVDIGVKAGDTEINGGFHANDQGQWGATLGADVDLGDGNKIGADLSLEGDGEKFSYGVGVDAQFGDKGGIGGFIQGNSEGDITAGVQGNINTGSTNVSAGAWVHHDKNGTSGGGAIAATFDGKGSMEASVNRSADGSVDVALTGGMKVGNTTITGGGFLHSDKNGTSGGARLAATIDGKGQIAASVNASSDGTVDAGIGGSAQIGNTTIKGAGYVHHDKNGTSGGGVLSANIDGKGQIAASVNASSDGTVDAGIGGSAQIGNTTIKGAGYVHHDKNGTSGGSVLLANIDGKGQIAASVNASSDGTVDAGIGGSAQIGNTTIKGAGYVHHDKNGTSGGGVLSANIDGKGQIAASVNASSDGTVDAGIGGSAQIGNTTIQGAGYVHHDKNGTSGGGVLSANIDGKGQIAASVNASSDGTVDAGIGGSAQIGNTTIQGASYVHHDKNGTSGGGVLSANIDGKGQIAASVNASSDGTVDAGIGGSAQIGNTTIKGAGYVHHDKNGTSGGGVLAANIDGKGQIAASVNASSDGTVDAGIGGSAQIGNTTIQGASYVHHDKNGTSGGGVLSANIDGKGQIAASVNASSDGTVDAGIGGSAQIGNTTIKGAGYVHHDKNGMSGGGVLSANIDGKGQIAASVNASSDGTVDAGIGGSAQIGNTTIKGAGYVHHDKNGTSGGGVLSANIDGKGQIAASVNASSDGTVDAGIGGSAQIGNTTIKGAGYVHHDKNGTSGGGVVAANIDGKGQIAASVNASSDGTVDAGIGGSAQIGNTTIQGAGYVHHDKNGTSGGGVLSANIDGKGQIAASVNASSDGTVDAGIGGSAQIGNTTIKGAGYVHHDKNGTSGGGVLSANIDGKGQIAASVNASSDGTVDAGIGGSAQIGNTTIKGAGYVHHDKNGTSGGGVLSANIDGKGQIAASVNASSDGTVDAGIGGSAQIGNTTVQGAGFVHHDRNGTIGEGSLSGNGVFVSINRSVDGAITPDFGVKNTAETDHHLHSRSAEKCSVGFSANVKDGIVDVGAEATIPGIGKFGAHASLKDGQLVGEISIGDFSFDLGDIQKLSMDTFNQLAGDFNIDGDSTNVVSGFRDGMRHQVCTSETEMSFDMETETMEEDFPARDRKDGVVYRDKHTDFTFFKISYTFGVGPIGIKLSFGAGGAIGTSMWSDIHANKGTAAFSIGPWVSGMVWGGLSIELGIASGGLKLIGYILKTKFPVTMETKSNKHPLTVVMNIDLELTPIELQLRGWAKVFFAKVFDKCLWKWACEPITWNILRKELENKDEEPPEFTNGSFCGEYRNKRSMRECSLKQLPNRHPTDTAFQLEVAASDEDSTVKTWYAIGFNPGGTDVREWTKFKGDNQVIPTRLPNGVPLHFTVKAKNEQGLESFIQCHIDTYDNTLPDGRVEASHRFSSHPSKISATVVVTDDSPITATYKALGLSPGEYGREIVDWDTLLLSKTSYRYGVSSDLKYFSSPRPGKLIVQPLKEKIMRTPELCARQCLDVIKCVSFNYEQVSETCQLHEIVESHFNTLHTSGDFKNYERLGVGYTAFIQYESQPLEHGSVYYVNTLIENSLKYKAALFSEGTLVDFTPPQTGFLGKTKRDDILSHQCTASIRQRCEQVTDKPNHRMVIDGPEGTTVFNGNKPLFDEQYTLSNHYVTANWDGFLDPESGIWGFSWAVGTSVCGKDIVSFVDPHRHITSPKYWTYSGFQENVDLPDGQYYVTVEALNNVVFGGALVTTVCHSVPFTVDTTPPLFHQITDVMFDEDFDILAAYYNVSDGQSSILRIDFGLGMTKHDVGLRPYSRHDFLDRRDPYLVIENLQLQPGIPAWVRLRAVNKVGLFASGHADAPIMVDKTPPIAGVVFDGDILRHDIQYQHDTENICAQWMDFFDPESGIRRFIWGVGTQPETDDVIAFQNISRFSKQDCAAATLQHNVTYYSTVVALNDALNSRRSNATSNGVLVDTTAPVAGYVQDINSDPRSTGDIDFSSETATVAAEWYNFSDLESGVERYDVSIEINSEKSKTMSVGNATSMVDHSLTLKHLDFIAIKVSAYNGANLPTTTNSNGFIVDHTPPNVKFIHDTKDGRRFQADNTRIFLEWEFTDAESGIDEYRYQIHEFHAGVKSTKFPADGDFQIVQPNTSSKVSVDLTDIHLEDGALYKAHIIALNRARLSASHDSAGVMVDVTPPIVTKVKLSMPKEEEDLDETDTYVLLAGPESLTVSWSARDPGSGIHLIDVEIGIKGGGASVTNGFKTVSGDETYAHFNDLGLQYYNEESSILYYVSVIAVNKAGLRSPPVSSKPIKVLHENVPGTIYDGRHVLQDTDFTRDKTSLAVSFSGFESETCNIVGYEWAIGSQPFLTDFMPFTDYGIVLVNESQGHAQIHLELYESQTYFSTVRARTGQMCKEQFILSASNGITFDTRTPKITLGLGNKRYNQAGSDEYVESFYQQSKDNIDLSWNATDESGVSAVALSIGTLPGLSNIYNTSSADLNTVNSISLRQGISNFVTIQATDNSGLIASLSSPAITVDLTVPLVKHYNCSKVLSKVRGLVGCEWATLSDNESPISSVAFAISSKPLGLDILNFTEIVAERTSWYRDIGNTITSRAISQVYLALRVLNEAGKEIVIEETAKVDKVLLLEGKYLL